MTIATGRAALIRDTFTEDQYGDQIPHPTVVVADFPISIIEDDVDEFDRASGEWRTIRKLIARPTSGVLPVDDGDRVQDLRTGQIYNVMSFTRTPRTLTGRASVTMQLEATTL